MRIGVISDTHGLLRPEAAQLLTNVEHILHAGDIGSADVIAALKRIAPTTAIRGNIDTGSWAKDLPETETVQLDGRTIHILHNLKELDRDPVESGFDAVISGHSHQPRIETIGGVLYLNPGSAGPRRFSLPIALATLELDEGAIRPKLHKLAA